MARKRNQQSGYQFKKYRTPACKMSSKTIYALEQQVEKSIGASTQALKKITNAIKKTRNYTERDKR
jgi:hypothetical protein